MARIQKVQAKVYEALLERPEARVDDYILVLEVFKHYISAEMSLKTVLEHHIELGLPSFASIVRTRRKLQRKYPELVNATMVAIREGEQKEYKAYAKAL
jgi:hypothetical protein